MTCLVDSLSLHIYSLTAQGLPNNTTWISMIPLRVPIYYLEIYKDFLSRGSKGGVKG